MRWIETLLAIGAVQGLFLVGALLLLRAKNRAAAVTLALLVAVFTFSLLEELIDLAGFYPRWPHTIAMAICGEFAIGPLLLFFVRAVTRRPMSVTRRWLHFLPLAGTVLAWLPFYLRSGEAKLAFLDRPSPEWMAPFVAVKGIYLLTYLAWAGWTLRPSRRTADLPSLAGLRAGWVGLTATAAAIYGCYFLTLAGVPRLPDSDTVSGLLLGAFTYGAAALVIFRRDLLEWEPPRTVLSEGRRSFVADELRRRMQQDELFRDPDLSLGRLAEIVRVSEHHLSEVINQQLGQSFYQFLNAHRLAAVEGSLSDPSLDHRTVLDLAFEAGFKSKATFYRLFRQRHGASPTEYRQRSRTAIAT